MPLDPRTPVLVGYGQVNQHTEDPGVEPVDLMVAASRAAADPRVLESVDAVRIVNLLSWRYRDPGLLLAQRIRADKAETRYTGIGGNVPQTLVNLACLDIQQGKSDVVLIGGAETWRTRCRLRAAGFKPNWTKQDDSVPQAPGSDEGVPMAGPAELRIHLDRPAYVYPLFEQAVRIAAGETPDEHRRRIGELWSQFSAVAAINPHAWSREALTAEQIWKAAPDNRMISWPYTKLMISNNMVDQGAVLILASAEKAEYLQIPSERWVFPYAGADSHDTYAIGERAEFFSSPAIRIAGKRALELAGADIGDIELVDVYSCFPSAVQIAAKELGLPIGDPGRPLTVTGGLTFAGGPWNNYVTHSIATMAEQLVAHPGRRGLITASGGYLTTAQLRCVRDPTTRARIPLGGCPARGRPGTHADSTGGLERRGHGRIVDHTRRPGRAGREGVPGGADLPGRRRRPGARGDHLGGRRRGHGGRRHRGRRGAGPSRRHRLAEVARPHQL